MIRTTALLAFLVFAAPLARATDLPPLPPTPIDTASDTYHGMRVADPYRWLEEGDDPKVHDWSVVEDARTRAYLDALPLRQAVHDRLHDLIAGTSPSYADFYAAGDGIFALYTEPPKQQPMLALLTRALNPTTAKVIVDPNLINPDGTTAIDWFVPSPDGTKVAVSLSDKGSEDGSVHVYDVATGEEIGTPIPRVQYPTGGGSLAWTEDGFYYTRYPGPERPPEEQHFFQQIWFHTIGTNAKEDKYVLGKDFPKVAEIQLDNRQNPHVVVATVANGDGGEFAHYLLHPHGRIDQVTHFADKIVAVAAGPDNNLYLVSRKDAPRGKLLKLPLSDPDLARATEIVPEGEAVIEGTSQTDGMPLVLTDSAIYLRELIGGPSQVARFDHDGKALGLVPLPPVVAVNEIVAPGDGSVIFPVAAYLRPPYIARFDEATGETGETKLVETSPIAFDDCEVSRVFATSKDGTKVPLNIIHKKGIVLDGSNPTLLTGYGGYGLSLVPRFLGAERRLWLDAGGVYVIANLRGGGEYGEDWHKQGSLLKKQNVFDDFLAAAHYLIDNHYTTSERLAFLGGSNGGLLMGAVMTQAPDLAHAIVSQVGIYDMLRVERDPNGLFNTTEFGTVADKAQFQALYAYSPYHHVVDGTRYPAVFMATGEHDGRVNPMHSRKMIARLQAANPGGRPIYLSINSKAGHGVGSALSVRIDQSADYLTFLFDQLGMKLPGS